MEIILQCNVTCFDKEIGIVMLFGLQSSKSGTLKDKAKTRSFSSKKTTPASKLLLKNSASHPNIPSYPVQRLIWEYTNTRDDLACLVWIAPLESDFTLTVTVTLTFDLVTPIS